MRRLKVGSWTKRAIRYIKTDFKEIVLPSTLPNPPSYKPSRKLSWKEKWHVLKEGTGNYLLTWKSKPRPAAQDADGKTGAEDGRLFMEDLAEAARGGADRLRPYLAQLYQTRMSSYQQAVSSFIQGYKEGVAEGGKPMPETPADGSKPMPEPPADGSNVPPPGTPLWPPAGGMQASPVTAVGAEARPSTSGNGTPSPAAADGKSLTPQGGDSAATGLRLGDKEATAAGEHQGLSGERGGGACPEKQRAGKVLQRREKEIL